MPNNRGVWNNGGGEGGGTQKLFWYQYNKGRTKCFHILKAHKFSLIMGEVKCNDFNSQCHGFKLPK